MSVSIRKQAASRRAKLDGPPILVVEDNDALREGICAALRASWPVVHEESNGDHALARLSDARTAPYSIVISDLCLPGSDGLAVLRGALQRDPGAKVILMTAYASVDRAVEAMRLGANDFIQKPFDLQELEARVRRLAERLRSTAGSGAQVQRVALDEVLASVVAQSQSMRDAIDLARQVADTRSTVLITGETGTGKEIIAGLIHSFSERADRSYVKVNCAALPETLLESELFGHVRGAFTGADRSRVGRFEQATGGTLFMDEVGDMTLATQAKLLRVLQDQEFCRLGGTHPVRTDARIVAATNRDLTLARANGSFREDLYFRLDVIGIYLRPLRERPEDLMLLCERFRSGFAREFDRDVTEFSEEARSRMLAYSWPGNVRELRNVIERAVLTCAGSSIDVLDLGLSSSSGLDSGFSVTLPHEGVALGDVEREFVVAALERTGFVQKDAAKLLRVSRRKLNYMIRRMGLTHSSWRRNRVPAAPAAEEAGGLVRSPRDPSLPRRQ